CPISYTSRSTLFHWQHLQLHMPSLRLARNSKLSIWQIVTPSQIKACWRSPLDVPDYIRLTFQN
ncbi:hypothetical protein HDU99_002680, partial [Rhizoclosmatium hyalinum]